VSDFDLAATFGDTAGSLGLLMSIELVAARQKADHKKFSRKPGRDSSDTTNIL
jgi:hypothetical protein